jgi:SAM-dependent methyltransferase
MNPMSSQFWDDRYRAEEYAYGREPNEFLRAEAHRIPVGRVLCLAEGEGRNAVFLAGVGDDVTAVDFSTEGLRKTERLAAERNVAVTTVHADLATYEPEADAFSGIVAIFAHLPPAVRKHVHGWIPRALRPGGVFVLEAYTPAQIALNTGGPRDPALLMTLKALKDELVPLAIEIGRELEREIHEGAFHGGPSATVQLVARRT